MSGTLTSRLLKVVFPANYPSDFSLSFIAGEAVSASATINYFIDHAIMINPDSCSAWTHSGSWFSEYYSYSSPVISDLEKSTIFIYGGYHLWESMRHRRANSIAADLDTKQGRIF